MLRRREPRLEPRVMAGDRAEGQPHPDGHGDDGGDKADYERADRDRGQYRDDRGAGSGHHGRDEPDQGARRRECVAQSADLRLFAVPGASFDPELVRLFVRLIGDPTLVARLSSHCIL